MISHTATQLAQLKAGHFVTRLIKFQIGSTWYYLTNGDREFLFESQFYQPGFIKSIGDVEITSEPKINDNDIVIHTHDKTIQTAVLSDVWMNKQVTQYKVRHDAQQIAFFSKIEFQGLLSDYSISEKDNSITLKSSSIWADFEKQVGIRTNLQSHQRHYPGDTAMRHSANATKKVYWGKDNPNSSFSSNVSGGGNGNNPINPPTQPV